MVHARLQSRAIFLMQSFKTISRDQGELKNLNFMYLNPELFSEVYPITSRQSSKYSRNYTVNLYCAVTVPATKTNQKEFALLIIDER